MALTVETGSGDPEADSYASLADATSYTTAQGLTWDGDDTAKEAALRRATLWLDTTYRGRFPGVRRRGRVQGLEWPRVGANLRMNDPDGILAYSYAYPQVYGYTGPEYPGLGYETLPFDTIPVEMKRATIEAAVRQLADNSALLPDTSTETQTGTGALKRRSAGDHVEEFFPGGSTTSTSTSGGSRGPFPIIDAILAGILIQSSGLTARAARA